MRLLHTTTTLEYRKKIKEMVDADALFVINHSGGKDSQAMYAIMSRLIPHDQIVVVHANLGDDVEHEGVQEHIRENTVHEVHIAQAIWKDGTPKTLLSAIERRGKWPSAAARYCTSDLKRGPCEKVIRRLLKETGRNVVVNCFGFRAEESAARAKREIWSRNKRNSIRSRDWYDFNPIHGLLTQEVFQLITSVGQRPHPVYAQGNERMSCVFCVLGCASDLKNGARLRPKLYAKYVHLGRKMGHTFRVGASLEEIVGIPVPEEIMEAA